MIDWTLPDPYYLFDKIDAGEIIPTEYKELVESVLSTDALYSYLYAMHSLKARFLAGEEAISKNAWLSLLYAEEVVNGRFEGGEPQILNSPDGELKKRYIEFLKGDTVNID